MTIAALVRASAVFGEPEWLVDRARRVRFRHRRRCAAPTGGSCTPGATGRAGARGLLDDYASMARAALALFEASGEPADLDAAATARERGARSCSATARAASISPPSDAADVPGARPRHAHDGATPSGVGLLAEVFARLWHLTDEARWREAAEGLIRAFSGAPEGLGASPLLLMGADMLERGGSVVIDGPLDDPLRARRSPRSRFARPILR